MATTFTKLKNGSWGLRVQGTEVSPGSRVTVTRKDGAQVVKTIGQVLWTGEGVSLCSIDESGAAAAPKSGTRNRRPFVPCGYPGCNSSHCDECDGEGRYGESW